MINNDLGFILFFLGTPVITLTLTIWLYHVWRKTWKHKKGGAWLALIPAAASAPVIGIVILLFNGMLWLWRPNFDFDRGRWDKKVEKRYQMTRDIIESGILIGKTPTEAAELLGPGYVILDDEEYRYKTDTTFYDHVMVWYIGQPNGGLMVLPPNGLFVYFEGDAATKAEEYPYSGFRTKTTACVQNESNFQKSP
jgi:hypothetical protein